MIEISVPTPVEDQVGKVAQRQISWATLAWFGGLLIACYAPVLWWLVKQWDQDADMGHGFFVPVIAAFLVWQRRDELLAQEASPNWWGLLIVVWGGLQL